MNKKILFQTLGYLLAPMSLMAMTPSPQIGLSFNSLDVTNARGSIVGVPCNPQGPVNSTQYVLATYQNIRTFNKITGQMDNIINVDAAPFSSYDNEPDNYYMYDPFMIYDLASPSGLFYFSGENGPDSDGLLLLVSGASTLTPTTQWVPIAIPSSTINPPGNYTDYQQPSIDQNAWYNCIGTFSTPDGSAGSFIGSTVTVIPKSSILAGTPTPTFFYNIFPEILGEVSEGFCSPAYNFDTDPIYGYVVWTLYDQPAGIVGNQIGFYRILNAGTSPAIGPQVNVTLPFNIAYNSFNAPHKGNLMGTGGLIQIGPGTTAPYVRNHQLYYACSVQCDSTGAANIAGDRIGIRWFQFDMTGDSTGQGLGTENPDTVPVLIQSGILFDDSVTNPLSYYKPAMMSNTRGDLVISFATSGLNAYIDAGYAFRAASDTVGQLRVPVNITNTTFPANFSANSSQKPGPNVQRWGDAASAVLDTNGLDFWLTQMYAGVENAWAINTTQLVAQ